MDMKDIPGTLEDFIEWSTVSPDKFLKSCNLKFPQAYAKEHMIPATTNRDVAGYTVDELLHSVPAAFGIKAFANKIVICTLEEHVRVAMM